MGKADFAEAIDATLLAGETVPAIPAGGCAYAIGDEGTANNSSSTYRLVQVWYFNLGSPGRFTPRDLGSWAQAAGGTPAASTDPDGKVSFDDSGFDFDLPADFSGWTGSDLTTAVPPDENWGWYDDAIPAHTQGTSARIEFGLNADRVEALIAATGAGSSSSDPTTALGLGVAAVFASSFGIQNEQGYTLSVDIQGRLQPFTSSVVDSPPGQFRAVSTSSAGGAITNTTAERNTDSPTVYIAALYPLESAACNGSNGISVTGASWQDPSYCRLTLGTLTSASLPPDGVKQFEAESVSHELGDFDEAGHALAQLNQPTSVYAFFGGSPGRTIVNWTASDAGCEAAASSHGHHWFIAMNDWPDVICG